MGKIEDLQAEYSKLINRTLPAVAAKRNLPVHLNHCFGRVILDEVCNGCWYNTLDFHSKVPAYKQLSIKQLARAVVIAKLILYRPADYCIALNNQSLTWRKLGKTIHQFNFEEIMGYTHSWTPTGNFTPEQFAQLKLNVAEIIKTASLPRYQIGIDSSDSTDTRIAINGCVFNKDPDEMDDDDLDNLTHETFELIPNANNRFSFCKTARKPYDTVVVACLLAAEADALSAGFTMNLGSDGETEDWQRGIGLYIAALPGAYSAYEFRVNETELPNLSLEK